ncbi:hypothetical protein [Solidesulfovibrio sp.]
MSNSKKREKSYNSPKNIINNFKVNLLRNRQQSNLLGTIRQNLNESFFGQIIDCVKASKPGIEGFGAPFPKSPKDILCQPILLEIEPEKELAWASKYLNKFSDNLTEFVSLANNFNCHLLSGRSSLALSTLDEVEDKFGFSWWYIKNRLSALQLIEGLESQKAFAKKIINSSSPNNILRFLTYTFSVYIEPSSSFRNLYKTVTNQTTQPLISSCIKSYVDHNLLFKFHNSEKELFEILRVCATGTVVDLYEAIIFIASSCSLLNFSHLTKPLTNLFSTLNIVDGRIENFLWFNNVSTKNDISKTHVLELYLLGQYEKALNASIESLSDNPTDLTFLDIASRSMAVLNIEFEDISSPLYNILNSLKNVYTLGEYSRFDSSELHKLALSFCPNSWANYIIGIIYQQLTEPDNINIERLLQLSIFSNNTIHPYSAKFIDTLPHSKRYQEFLDQLDTTERSWLLCRINSCDEHNCISMTSDEMAYLCAIKNAKCGNYATTETQSSQLIKSTVYYYYIQGVKLYSYSLMMQNKTLACIQFIADSISKNYVLHKILPIEGIIQIISDDFRVANKSEISLPIVYDIYTREVSNKLEHLRRYSFEDFLEAHNVLKPSLLSLIEKSIPKHQAIYFYKYLCIESNMSLMFTSSEDVYRDRADVCKNLTLIDSEKTDIYQQEIKDIYRRSLIKKKTQEVEKSKIYVDINNLKLVATKELKEKFDRYKSYLEVGLNEETFNYINSAKVAAKDLNTIKLFEMKVPKNEMVDLITSLIIDLLDLFVYNNEHGLDGYLGVRIRHNTLSSKLRGPLVSANLITQIDSKQHTYKPNDWSCPR